MKKQNLLIILAVIVLLGLVVGINYKMTQSQTEVDDDGNPVANPLTSAPAPPPPSAAARPVTPPPAQPQSASAGSPNIAPLPSELELGPAKAATTVALGYTMDSQTASDSSKAQSIVAALTSWAHSHPNISVKIVSLDLPKDQLSDPSDQNLPLGLSFNGKSAAGLAVNPGEGNFNTASLTSALSNVH